jgi:hypothetical protein
VLVRLALVGAVGSLALLTNARAFAADEAEASESKPARTVEIVVVGSDLDLEAVRTTVGPSGFEGATVRWTRATRLEAAELLERRPEASDAPVRAWIDLSDPKNASLYFADRAGERFLVRAIALPDGLSPLGREALGQVLELSVRALLEDDRIGMSRAETSELLKARSAPEPKRPPPRKNVPPEPAKTPRTTESSLGAETFYAARLFSRQVALVHGPGLGLGWVTESPETRSALWVTGQYELPAELVTPEVGVEWTTLRVQGGAGLAVAVAGSRFFAGGRLGAGIDVTSFTPRRGSSGDDVTLERSRVSTAPVLTLALEGSLPLAARLDASARLFAGFYPVRVHYDLARGSERSEVLVPYRVRPGVELCLHLR